MNELEFGRLLSSTSRQLPFILVILGFKEACIPHLETLLGYATYVICADSGYDRLLEHYKDIGDSRKPDIIVGDLDSLSNFGREWAERNSIRLVQVSDQSQNDFQKALQVAFDEFQGTNDYQIVCIGGVNGRFDHTCAAISALYEFKDGRTTINIDSRIEGNSCGLIPFTGRSVVHSEDEVLTFDGHISTSNSVACERIVIESDNYIIWTIELLNK